MATGKNLTIRPPKSKVDIHPVSILPNDRIGITPSRKDLKKRQDMFLRRFNRASKELKIKLQEQERLENHQLLEKQAVEISVVSGSISTLRDEDGNMILFEDSAVPNQNVERHDQFVSIELYNEEFDISAAVDVIDFSIVELKRVDNRIDLLDNFLKTFRDVLPDIPDTELQFIIRRVVEEQGGELVDPDEFERLTKGNFSDIIRRLISLQDNSEVDRDEIESLTSQVGNLTQQLDETTAAMAAAIAAAATATNGVTTLPGPVTEPVVEPVSIIKVRAHRFFENTVGEELGRFDDFLASDEIDDSIDLDTRGRDPQDIERDERRLRRQRRARNIQRAKARRIAEEESSFDKMRRVEVTFMTETGEAPTVQMTVPFDVRVPIRTVVNSVDEIVTGVKFKLIDLGDFKGWFRNNFKATQAVEYVTETLDPETIFTLKIALDRFDDPNRNIPDDRFPQKDAEFEDFNDNSNVQSVTVPPPPSPPPIPTQQEETTEFVIPQTRNPKLISTESPNVNTDPTSKKRPPTGDPDMPIIPLTDNEIEIHAIESAAVTQKESSDGLVNTPVDSVVDSVVDITPVPLKNEVIVVPPPIKGIRKSFGGFGGFGR